MIFERLAKAGGPTFEEKDATCCYAHSEKQWVADPQGVVWETFYTHGESTVYGQSAAIDEWIDHTCCEPQAACCDFRRDCVLLPNSGRLMVQPLLRRLLAEGLGTAFLLATVIGSGIMAEQLAGGNAALALLCNTLATGAILFVLIIMLGPISGAHFNPAVTGVFLLNRELAREVALPTIGAQCAGALLGVLVAHLMFGEAIIELSEKVRSGPSQWFSEWVATFGLVSSILLTRQANPSAIPAVVGLYITAAYWFTASTSFANPVATLARAFSDSFAGIRLADVPAFVGAQLLGAFCALHICRVLTNPVEGVPSEKARPAE